MENVYTLFYIKYLWLQTLHRILTGYKRHGLWFSTKSCSCYSTKTVNSVILKVVFVEHHTPFNVCFTSKYNYIWGWGLRYLHKFSLSSNYMTSLRTTTSNASFEPSDTLVSVTYDCFTMNYHCFHLIWACFLQVLPPTTRRWQRRTRATSCTRQGGSTASNTHRMNTIVTSYNFL